MDTDSRIDEVLKRRGVSVSDGNTHDDQYRPNPGDSPMGNVPTPSSRIPQQGSPATQMTMPDAKDETIIIGDVSIIPNGFFQSQFEVQKAGRRVNPTQCLRTVYDALKAQPKAWRK